MLANLAEELQMTAFLVVADGDEAVTIDSVEPTSLDAHVAYRPGTRHPIDRGAPGLALLAGRPAVPGERAEVAVAREPRLGAERGRGHRRHGLDRRPDRRPGCDRRAVAGRKPDVAKAHVADRLTAAAAEVAPPPRVLPRSLAVIRYGVSSDLSRVTVDIGLTPAAGAQCSCTDDSEGARRASSRVSRMSR